MKQRILVLGSEHFVGAKVSAALAASDWATPVPCPGRLNSRSTLPLEDIHAVFNGTMGQPSSLLANARTLYSVLERTGNLARVVHLSSMTVYGSHRGDATEGTPLRMDAGAYGAAQVEAETLAGRHPDCVILRPGCEYGAGCPQWSERIARLLLSHRLGDLGAGGDGTCNLIFIDDLVAAVLKSLQLPDIAGHCFNLAMRTPPTWNAYLGLFARALGAVPLSRISARRMRFETRLLAPLLKVLELAAVRLHGQSAATPPAITPSLAALCSQEMTLNSGQAERLLDLNWTPLSDGLRQAAAPFVNRHL